MNDLTYKQKVLDGISDSFCAAKWYNATIWLGSGQTTSCHHPPAHAIDAEAIKTNPSAIHNTLRKKLDRSQMQRGLRPAGCEYCWKIEDSNLDPDYVKIQRADFYRFFSEHDRRRGTDFLRTFPQMKEFWNECKYHANR